MPKGDCFIVALDLALHLESKGASQVKVVHGLPIGTGLTNRGLRYWHGWIEFNVEGESMVIDYSNDKRVIMPMADYYRLGQIKQVYRYTVSQARVISRKQDTYGPWAEGWAEMEEVPITKDMTAREVT